jgi:hypothetical protein
MKAFEIKDALDALLTAGADGLYAVITLKSRLQDAKSVFETPVVTVRYTGGRFDKRTSSGNSPYTHDATFSVEILTAAKAGVNLDALNDPLATDAERAAALMEGERATARADAKARVVVDRVFDLIMRPQNRRLGLPFDPNRWVDEARIDDPAAQGGLVTVSAAIAVSCACAETVTLEQGTPGAGVASGIQEVIV